jgi:tRNA(Ile)-lysidine synthetase-like protein
MPAALLTTLPRAVAARAVRSALRRHLSPYPGSADDVEAVLTVAGGGATSHQVSGALRVEREGPFVALYVMGDTVPRPVSLVVPGRTVFGDHALRTELTEAGARHGTRTIHVDPATSDGSLEVRAVADGDRIEIRGGSKPVRQALAERGVPIRLRAAWPVLVADAKIAAVPAVRVATWATPAGATAMAITDERSIW